MIDNKREFCYNRQALCEVRVQFNGRTPAFQAGCVGPIPITRSKNSVAVTHKNVRLELRWIEQRPSKPCVGGSSPSRRANLIWRQQLNWWSARLWSWRSRVQNPSIAPLFLIVGVSPSGKAPDFDSGIRRFKSCHPSQNFHISVHQLRWQST